MIVNREYFSKIEAIKNLTDDQRSRVIPLCEEVVFQEVCTRNGCKKNSLEFKNIDDAFRVFQNQDEVGLF